MLLADFVELRLTYIMCHQVNKQMGCTILMDVALEITVAHSPWESGQVVVALSRTKFCNQIIPLSATIQLNVTPFLRCGNAYVR